MIRMEPSTDERTLKECMERLLLCRYYSITGPCFMRMAKLGS